MSIATAAYFRIRIEITVKNETVYIKWNTQQAFNYKKAKIQLSHCNIQLNKYMCCCFCYTICLQAPKTIQLQHSFHSFVFMRTRAFLLFLPTILYSFTLVVFVATVFAAAGIERI